MHHVEDHFSTAPPPPSYQQLIVQQVEPINISAGGGMQPVCNNYPTSPTSSSNSPAPSSTNSATCNNNNANNNNQSDGDGPGPVYCTLQPLRPEELRPQPPQQQQHEPDIHNIADNKPCLVHMIELNNMQLQPPAAIAAAEPPPPPTTITTHGQQQLLHEQQQQQQPLQQQPQPELHQMQPAQPPPTNGLLQHQQPHVTNGSNNNDMQQHINRYIKQEKMDDEELLATKLREIQRRVDANMPAEDELADDDGEDMNGEELGESRPAHHHHHRPSTKQQQAAAVCPPSTAIGPATDTQKAEHARIHEQVNQEIRDMAITQGIFAKVAMNRSQGLLSQMLNTYDVNSAAYQQNMKAILAFLTRPEGARQAAYEQERQRQRQHSTRRSSRSNSTINSPANKHSSKSKQNKSKIPLRSRLIMTEYMKTYGKNVNQEMLNSMSEILKLPKIVVNDFFKVK